MEGRRFGVPRTEEERERRHQERFPGTSLPERGTGLGRRIQEEDNGGAFNRVLAGVLSGVGIGVGFLIVKKIFSQRTLR